MRKFAGLWTAWAAFFVFCMVSASHADDYTQKLAVALEWLDKEQDPDSGLWGPESVRDTAAVLRAVSRFPDSGIDVQAARHYLSEQQPASTDCRAHKIIALADDAHAVDQDVAELLLRQNSDGGFGFSDGYPGSVIDSILALDALLGAGIDGEAIGLALGYLAARQQGSGAFSYSGSGPESLEVTCRALIVMNRLQPRYNLSSFAERAAGFIAGHQNVDGGFGEDGSSVVETSLAILALQAEGSQSQAVSDARAFLLSVQDPVSGSWNGRVRDTALALAALHASAGIDLPNLQVHPSGISVQPAHPAAGQQVTVTCEVRNTGSSTAENIEIELYRGDPEAGGQFLASGEVASLAPGGNTGVQLGFVLSGEPGRANLYVIVDPHDLVEEISTADNVAVKSLTAGTLPDLIIAGIELNHAALLADEPFTLAAQVHNLGESDAGPVTVGLYEGNPAASAPLLEVALNNVCGGCSGRADFELTMPAGAYGYVVSVSAGPGVVEEHVDNNDKACPFTVMPGVIQGLDLAVEQSGLSFLPAYPREDEQISISALIRNRGDVAARDAVVELFAVDAAQSAALLHAFSGVEVSAGGSVTLTLDGVSLDPGAYRIFAAVTVSPAQQDETPSNNIAYAALNVLGVLDVVDLGVDALTITPAMPHAGDPAIVRCRITNHGNVGLAGVAFGVYDGDPLGGGRLVLDSLPTIAWLGAGQSLYASGVFDTAGRGGEQTLYAFVDPEESFAEVDEENNSAWGSFAVIHDPGPDLAISADSLAFSPSAPSIDDDVTMYATVCNQGSRPVTDPFDIALDAGQPHDGMQPIAVARVDSLEVHSCVSLAFSARAALLAASQSVFVQADSQDAITETNEYNNTVSMTLLVSSPDLSITADDLSVDSGPLLPGESFTLDAVIHNIGTHEAYDVEAAVYSGPPDTSPELGRVNLPLVAADASAPASFSISLPAGAHTLHVVADPGGFVPESGTANNSASFALTVGVPEEDPVLDLAASRVRRNPNNLPDSAAITVSVSNTGTVDVDPGIDVAFYSGDPAQGAILLGVEQTASGLASGAYADVTLIWEDPVEGEYHLFVVVDDDGTGQGRLAESNEANNTAAATVAIAYSQNLKDRAVSQGVQWLVEHQHSLGGWEDFAPARANAAALHALHISGRYLDPEFSGMYATILRRVRETQATNGSWENNVSATADSVLALVAVGEDISSPVISNALIWLQRYLRDDGVLNSSPVRDTGHALWALMEAGVSREDPAVQAARQWLLDSRNPDGFWGFYAGEASAPTNMHYAVAGLHWACHESDSAGQAAITQAVNWYRDNIWSVANYKSAYLAMLFYTGRNAGDIAATMNDLKALQSANGGWVDEKPSATPLESPRMTAESVISLYRSSDTGGGAAIRKAFQWLKTMMVEPDGDFQNPYDQAIPTSLALLALDSMNDAGGYNATIVEALVRIISTQKSNGNWHIQFSMIPQHHLTAGAAVLRALGQTGLNVSGKTDAMAGVIQYLFGQQNDDGGWYRYSLAGGGPSEINPTILCVLGLLSDGVMLTGAQRDLAEQAIEWLLLQKTGTVNWETISHAANSLKILNKFGGYQTEVDDAVAWLQQRQNADGGWGEYESTVQDTACVLLALIQTDNQGVGTARAVQWLLAVQNADGGWPILPGLRSSTNPTGYAVRALALADYTPGPELAISFDKPAYQPGDTVIVTVEPEEDAFQVQQVSGSVTEYEGSTHSIAFAKIGGVFIGTHVLSAAHSAGTDIVSIEARTIEGVPGYGVGAFVVENTSDVVADLAIAGTDIMFSPEAPDEGRTVLIAARVRNIGLIASAPTSVRFLNGTEPIGSDQALGSLAPGASDIVFKPWDTHGQLGSNYIHVVVDPVNAVNDVNRVNNSAVRPIDVVPRSLSDLEVRDTDISFADASPVEGALVSVSAAVRNLGADVDGVTVHFYDSEVAAEKLIAERIIHEIVPHGGSRTASALFDTAGRTGERRIIVQSDPQGMIREQNENNNTGSALIRVVPSGLALELNLDRDQYGYDEDVVITARITNSSPVERTVLLDVAMLDSNGTVAAEPAKGRIVVLPPGGTVVIDDFVWNTGSAPAGQLSVAATLFEDGQRRAAAAAPFVILADRTVGADVSTERRLYYDHAQVRISSVLQSFSPNYAFSGLSAFVELLSPRGDVLYTDEHAVGVLPPLAGRSWEQAWNTARHAPGLYTLNLSVEQDGTPVASDRTHFTIAPSADGGRGLGAFLTAEPAQVHRGQDVALNYGVTNSGNTALDETALVSRAVNTSTRQETTVFETTCMFDGNDCSGTSVLESAGLACGDYVIILSTMIDGTAHNLAFAPLGIINRCPVAVAGENILVHVGDFARLDGSGSYDADGDSISYSWALAASPEGSITRLAGSDIYNPTLLPDRHGAYELRLSVSDGMCRSRSDSVLVTTENRPPLAVAGESLLIEVGETVQLEASASYDPDNDTIVQYEWTLAARPEGSAAELSDRFASDPVFQADMAGVYRLQLVVRDFEYASDPVELEVTTRNRRPLADAGPDREVNEGDAVRLDASASHDPDADPLTYQWAIVNAPEGSTAVLNDSTLPDPVFTADKAGAYIIQLIVNDGELDSIPDTCAITIPNQPVECVDSLGVAQDYSIFSLGPLASQHATVSGRVAAAGDVELENVVMGTYVPHGAPERGVLVSGGDIEYGIGVVHRGSIVASGSVDGVSCMVRRTMARGATVAGNAELPFGFEQESSRFRLLSTRLGGLAPTGTASTCAAVLTLRGSGTNPVQIFNISAQQLRSASSLHLSDIPRNATVIINISGEHTEVSHIGMAVPGWMRGYILFNFFEATSFDCTAVALNGSVLAPLAELTNNSGIISGTVIVKSWQGSMNVGHEPFIGTLPECEPQND